MTSTPTLDDWQLRVVCDLAPPWSVWRAPAAPPPAERVPLPWLTGPDRVNPVTTVRYPR